MVNMASEIKVRAERKLGEMITDGKLSGHVMTPEKSQRTDINPVINHDKVVDDSWPDPPTPKPVNLAEIGITRDQSSRFQKIAAISEEHFESAVNMAKDAASAEYGAREVGEVTEERTQSRSSRH